MGVSFIGNSKFYFALLDWFEYRSADVGEYAVDGGRSLLSRNMVGGICGARFLYSWKNWKRPYGGAVSLDYDGAAENIRFARIPMD